MQNSTAISIDKKFIRNIITDSAIRGLTPQISHVFAQLLSRKCKGNNFLGWLDLPYKFEQNEISRINDLAREIREKAEYLVVIGIGGSYLGAKATIDFLSPQINNLEKQRIIYLGNNISGDYFAEILRFLDRKNYYINVISKSGTTTEPGIAFRVLKDHLEKTQSPDVIKERIIATTDRKAGALRKMVNSEEYRDFIIPDDVGGRFSVLTPVGLLPIAAAGFDIHLLLKGAQDMSNICKNEKDLFANPALLYAAIRFLLYKKGKKIEILSTFEPYLNSLIEWWKQLFGESEGKENKALYPSSASFTTDLHSMGQYVQQGERILFETFLKLPSAESSVAIPALLNDEDGMNYLAGKTIDQVNDIAYEATRLAHYEGGVPNLTLEIPQRNEYYLGQIYYLFEFAVAISGLLLDVNPFNQPGVEDYKNNMFALLGKPGFEEKRNEIYSKLS